MAYIRRHAQLKIHQADKDYISGWGFYDDEFMGFSHDEIRALSQADAPLLLSVLTFDTRQRGGHPSKSCEPYLADDNPMLQAVHCSLTVIRSMTRFSPKAIHVGSALWHVGRGPNTHER